MFETEKMRNINKKSKKEKKVKRKKKGFSLSYNFSIKSLCSITYSQAGLFQI
jgi:hypothetical protein